MNVVVKNIVLILVVCYLYGAVFPYSLSAQDISVSASLDTNRALIGDHLDMQLNVSKPEDTKISFPEITGELTDKIEVVNKSVVDTLRISEGYEMLQQKLVIAVFDTGFFEIPPLSFVDRSGELPDTIETLPVALEIIPLPLETDIRDIKANYNAPVTILELLPYLIALLFSVALILFIRYYYRKRYKKMPVALACQMLDPPDVVALNELEKLRSDAPWLHNRIKYYYIRLSEILRNYIERRFQIAAPEKTTEEILHTLKNLDEDSRNVQLLLQILTLADLVKFAKVVPDREENENQIGLAVEYIRKTTAGTVEKLPGNRNIKPAMLLETQT
ncbi:MAG: hypothetical protein JXA61_08105 [Bacteroidales bacterium]|nr:hypothetical protein [Bacteroidales bacterium]